MTLYKYRLTMSTPFSPFKHHFLVDYDLYPCILQCDDLCVDLEKTSSLGLQNTYELRAVLCVWSSVRRGKVTRRSSSLLSVWFLVRCEEVTRRSFSFLLSVSSRSFLRKRSSDPPPHINFVHCYHWSCRRSARPHSMS